MLHINKEGATQWPLSEKTWHHILGGVIMEVAQVFSKVNMCWIETAVGPPSQIIINNYESSAKQIMRQQNMTNIPSCHDNHHNCTKQL